MFICGLLLAGSLAGLIAMIPPPKSEEPQRKTAIAAVAAVAAVQALRRGFDLPPAGESRYVQNEVLLDIPATVPTTTLGEGNLAGSILQERSSCSRREIVAHLCYLA
jgi:hypothetical protein